MTASVPLSHTTNSVRLAEWWWVLFVGSPSASVRELLQTRAEQPKNGELCNLVPGVTKDLFKTLRLDSLNSLTHKDIWQFCETMDLTPQVLRLQEEAVSFYRGLAVNDVYMASSQKSEGADSIFTKCNRLVLLEWKIDGRPAYTINGRPAQTLLFVSKVDLSTRWLLFHNDFALFHSRGAALTVSVWLGPWSSLTIETFSLVRDSVRAETVACHVGGFLHYHNAMDNFIRPSEFGNAAVTCGNCYACLGGPGIGKTTKK